MGFPPLPPPGNRDKETRSEVWSLGELWGRKTNKGGGVEGRSVLLFELELVFSLPFCCHSSLCSCVGYG